MGNLLIGPRPPRWRTIKVVTRNAGRYLFGSAIRNWARNIGSTAPALGSMTLLLLLVGLAVLAGLVGQNIATTEARDASVLHLYLRDDANSADINSLESQLGANRYVQNVVYVSKDQALARAQHRPGLPGARQRLREQSLPGEPGRPRHLGRQGRHRRRHLPA